MKPAQTTKARRCVSPADLFAAWGREHDAAAEELRESVGPDAAGGIPAARWDRAVFRIQIVRLWFEYRRVAGTRYGNTADIWREFVQGAAWRWGRRLCLKTVQRWVRAFERYGPKAMLDFRGRRAGMRPLDARLFMIFCDQVSGGQSQRAAHRLVADIAADEGRQWPSIRTLQLHLKREAVPKPVRVHPGHRSYLTDGVGRN